MSEPDFSLKGARVFQLSSSTNHLAARSRDTLNLKIRFSGLLRP
jgi:hypothetical protein